MTGHYHALVDRTRAALAARVATTSAGQVLREYFGRGKMLRGHMALAAAAAVGGDPADALAAAEAVELLHGASLFHDDIIDDASERRGLAALHHRLGVGGALVVADELFFQAWAALAEAKRHHPPLRVLHALETLNGCARECCSGQFRELAAGPRIAEDEYFAIVRGKTAAPFVAAAALGAILGGGTPDQIGSLRRYAEHVGISFQIADDVLDIVGNRAALGKPPGNSLALGRPMLPLLYLWRLGCQDLDEEIDRLRRSGWPRDGMLALLAAHDVLARVRETQQHHLALALDALGGVDDGTGRRALAGLAAYATELATPDPNVPARSAWPGV